MNHIINFRTNGRFDGLHTDRTDLNEVGSMSVKRASWVDFNESTQVWEVRWSPKAPPVFSNHSREACIEWEREQLQKDKYEFV